MTTTHRLGHGAAVGIPPAMFSQAQWAASCNNLCMPPEHMFSPAQLIDDKDFETWDDKVNDAVSGRCAECGHRMYVLSEFNRLAVPDTRVLP